MQILDTLTKAQNGTAIATLARTFGADRAATEAAVAEIVPDLARAMERNTLSRGGLADLVQALGSGAHERYLDDPTAIGDPNVRDTGNRILWHLVGEKDKSRAIANRAAGASGLDAETIKKMLPYVAALTMGGLARDTRVGFGDILSKIPNLGGDGWGNAQGGVRGGVQMPSPGSWPQQQGPVSRDGGFGTGGGFGGGMGGGPSGPSGDVGQQMPLPVPGDPGRGGYGGGGSGGGGLPGNRNPLEDLSDILRRGGGAGGMGGSVLWSIVRSILGGAAGFNGGGGVMNWIFRTIVLRYGWSIVSTIVRRVLLGR